jgi:hypothetical protein
MNLMTQIYIGYVEEIIYKNDKPTLELRVRIPSIHGLTEEYGLTKENLPIAKPMFVPGTGFNYSLLEETVLALNKVLVIFESGNLNKPIYIGLKGNEDLFNIPGNIAYILFYNNKEEFPEIGKEQYFYWDQSLDILYYWSIELESYVAFLGAGISNLILYATNTPSDISNYFKLVTSTLEEGYNTNAINISTGQITQQNQLIAKLVSKEDLLKGKVCETEIRTTGNIRKVSGNNNELAEFYFEVYRRTQNGTEIFLGISDTTPNITSQTYEEFSASAVTQCATWIETDRIVIYFYGNNKSTGGTGATYEFQFGGLTPVRTIFTVPSSSVSQKFGDIKNDGTIIESSTAIATGDKLIIADASNNLKIVDSNAVFGANDNTFLRKDGTFALPELIKNQNSTSGLKIWVGSQTEYNNISVKDTGTIYFIT